ncbi:MAG TPA: hypothetical protein VN901_10640 [Candidatus Acidoferrales bacterium]|nr:hypothetical protein [Candidatus Acidoferrales bacterium]
MIMVLLLGFFTTGCGGNSNSHNINGSWTADLTHPDGSPAFNFTTNFIQ